MAVKALTMQKMRFGPVAKDARIKAVLYPVLIVLGALLTEFGHFLWEEYGPGPIYLTVQVNEHHTGKPLAGALVGFTLPKRGGYKPGTTDRNGRASFEIDHRNKGAEVTLGVVLDHYRQPSKLPIVVLSSENLETSVELDSELGATGTSLGQPKLYRSPGGYWEKTADGWIEHSFAHPEASLRFTEFRQDADYIYLVDRSRLKENNSSNPLLLRLPIKGGNAQWSWQNPMVWIDLTIVSPEQ